MTLSRLTKGTKRFALALIAVVFALPGVASADHLTCTPSNCPSFVVGMDAKVSFASTDTPSSITFDMSQADEAMPAVQVDYMIPKGWKFGVNQIRPGQNPSGAPATSCADVYSSAAPTASAPRALQRAETLGAKVGMKVQIDNNRTIEGDPIDNAAFGYSDIAPIEFGYRDPASNDKRSPSVAFLNYDQSAGVARICYYLQNNAPGSPPSLRAAYLLEGQLIRIDGDPAFGWRLHLDFADIIKSSWFGTNHGSILLQTLGLEAVTGSRWNRNPVTGQPEAVVFSRTPSTPGAYEFRGIFSSCADGMDLPNTATGCKNNNLFSKTVSETIQITAPAAGGPHGFGRLRGPVGTSAVPAGYGLIKGNAATVSWTQPVVGPDEAIKGYAVVVAEPGNQDSRHFEYLVTNPALETDPNYREICGADGAGVCNLQLGFPLAGLAQPLPPEGLYDVALVTIYRDGHRTDGLCDNGTAQGATCDPRLPAFYREGTGISTWRFYITEKPWPNVFQENRGSGATAGPAYTLMVDFAEKRAQFIIWATPYAPCGAVCQPWWEPARPGVYSGTDVGIAGDANNGVISFGSLYLNQGKKWRFDGAIQPNGGNVRGVFTVYDTQYIGVRMPNVPPDAGNPVPPPTWSRNPTLMVEPFEGTRI